MPTQPNVIRVETQKSRYRFDELKHGDALEVDHPESARELFRQWRSRNKRKGAQLVKSQQSPKILYFIDDGELV